MLCLFKKSFKLPCDIDFQFENRRRTHNVSDKAHFEILQEFGWTEDEYDDGERV